MSVVLWALSPADKRFGAIANGMMLRSILITLTVLMLAATPVRAADKRVVFRGKVVDAAGKPVLEAEVVACELVPTSDGLSPGRLLARTTTKADGALSVVAAPVRAGPPGVCVIAVRKAGMAMGWANWRMWQDVNERIVLGKAEKLSGTVVDEAGRPIGGAEVMGLFSVQSLDRDRVFLLGCAPMPWCRTRTDANGRFEFRCIPDNATVLLLVSEPGYVPRVAPDGWYGPENRSFTPGGGNVRITMAAEAVVSGTVVDKKTGKGVDGIKLMIRPVDRNAPPLLNAPPFVGQTVKVIDGKFTTGQLAGGVHTVSVVAQKGRIPKWLVASGQVFAKAGQKITDAKVELVTGGLVEVAVADGKTKTPVKGVRVIMCPQRNGERGLLQSRTDKDGVARFRVMPGRYELWAVSGNQEYMRKDFHRGEGSAAVVEEGKIARLEVAVSKRPKVTGVVRDEAGRPVEGAAVGLGHSDSTVRTGKDGEFEILADRVPTGKVGDDMILVRHVKRKLAAAITVPKSLKAKITLQAAAVVRGRVVGPAGQPIAKAHVGVTMRPENGMTVSLGSALTDAKGRYKLGLLPGGQKCELTASAEGYGRASQEFVSQKARTLDLKGIVLPLANLKVSGVVLDGDGKPMTGVTVWVSRGSRGQTVTDASGRFEIKGLAKGEVVLSARRDRRFGSTYVKAGQTGVKIILRHRGRKPRPTTHPTTRPSPAAS